MILLHAGILDRRLFIWGEAPGNEAPRRERRGPRKRESQPAPFPYDAGAERLSSALASAGLNLKVVDGEPQRLAIWLPTVGGQPVPSSPLIAELLDDPKKGRLAPWMITAIQLQIPDGVDLLSACVGREVVAPGVIAGRDLAFWAAVARFAGTLVARQHLLPDLVEADGEYRARWSPVFAGADLERAAKLAKAMPSVCRALRRDQSPPSSLSAMSLLTAFVSDVVDYLVRSSLIGQQQVTRHAGTAKKQEPSFDSIHERWLFALRSPDPSMQGERSEIAHLAQQLRQWRRPIAVTTTAPFRLCFRLDEPGNGSDAPDDTSTGQQWRVRYLLQAADDPSLFIPAGDVWRGKSKAALVLKQFGSQAREYLLLALGQASNICPRIEMSLASNAPSGYALDSTAANQFLTETAWALEQAGFGVLLPAWWTRKGTKLRLALRGRVRSPKLKGKMQGGAGLSLDGLVQVDWEVALGGETLTRRELQALAELKAPLVRLRGQWVQLNADEIQAALEFWRDNKSSEVTAREALRMSLGGTESAAGLPFAGIEASGWLAGLLKQLEGERKIEELPAPSRFTGVLRPYQLRGYCWLDFLTRRGLGACLADDMGLGKTVQTLALIQKDWELGERRPALLICPTSVTTNWQKEAARFTPDLPVMVHHGVGRQKGAAFKKKAARYALVISSYSLLHRDLDTFEEVPWSAVILDEAQNIKNPETKQSRAARSLKSAYRAALTGTPVENNVGDLWSIMEFLNPGLLGNQAEFKRRFFLPIQTASDPEATRQLKKLTGPFILRRLKTDKTVINDLPDKMEMKVFCTLTREQASLYEAVVREATRALDDSEGIERKGVVLATLSKLKQVCNHPAQFLGDNSAVPGRSGKLARLTEMLEEVLQIGERALIFSQFAEMGEIIKRHVQESFGREALFLHGGVARRHRDRMVDRFQAGDGPSVFILSLKAGGAGLNLTRANHVFHFDRWWNPAVENQATDRAFRIGQTRNVQVHKFICAGTLEDKIDEMIERKKEIAANIVGSGEGWLTELSTAELKELFALRQEAIGDD